jgi:DNA-binding response OmpR family regulator
MLPAAEAGIASLRRYAGAANELQQLRDRVAELEELLGVSDEIGFQVLGLTPTEAGLLGMLIKKDFVAAASIYCGLFGGRPECDQPDGNIIAVYISKLRKKIGVEIVNVRGTGYFMRERDKEIIRARRRSVIA